MKPTGGGATTPTADDEGGDEPQTAGRTGVSCVVCGLLDDELFLDLPPALLEDLVFFVAALEAGAALSVTSEMVWHSSSSSSVT